MAGGFLGGYFVGLSKGMTIPRTPKSIDYSNVIEVGDMIGFTFAEHYHEGIIREILDKLGKYSCDDDNVEYLVEITRDESPRLFSNWVGRIKLIDMNYRKWTMIKKNPTRSSPVNNIDIK